MIPRSTQAVPMSSQSRSGSESGGSDTNVKVSNRASAVSALSNFDTSRRRAELSALSTLNTFLKLKVIDSNSEGFGREKGVSSSSDGMSRKVYSTYSCETLSSCINAADLEASNYF